MRAEIKIPYRFEPRFYQMPFLNALDAGFKRIIMILHRRAGKDKTMLNLAVKRCFERVGLHTYLIDTATHGRKTVWDAIDGAGFRFMDHFPREFVTGVNNQEMKLNLANGSIFQLINTDDPDRVVGSNPVSCFFSEYSLQRGNIWDLVRPILVENKGCAIFNYTPRGRKNHGYHLYQMGLRNKESWFVSRMGVDITKVLTAEQVEDEIRQGMSRETALQEFYCCFNTGGEGSYFTDALGAMLQEHRYDRVEHDPDLPVYTFWDLGVSDKTAIVFAQILEKEIRIIDHYENEGLEIKHYIEYTNELKLKKGYKYGNHYAPHDAHNRNIQTGMSLIDYIQRYHYETFLPVPRVPVKQMDIENTRQLLYSTQIDTRHARGVFESLESYREKIDANGVRTGKPEHGAESHTVDAVMLMYRAIHLGMVYDRSDTEYYSKRTQWAEPAGFLL